MEKLNLIINGQNYEVELDIKMGFIYKLNRLGVNIFGLQDSNGEMKLDPEMLFKMIAVASNKSINKILDKKVSIDEVIEILCDQPLEAFGKVSEVLMSTLSSIFSDGENDKDNKAGDTDPGND